MNNQNNKLQIIILVLSIIIIFTTIFGVMYDNICLVIISEFCVVGLVITFLLMKFWDRIDKKKLKKYSIIIGSVALVTVVGICIANACIPTISEDEFKDIVKSQIQPQIDAKRSASGLSDLDVKIKVYDYEYEKPSLFDKGYICAEVACCYTSNGFAELENRQFDEKTFSKYKKFDFIDLDGVKIDRHSVSIVEGAMGHFIDKNGFEYLVGSSGIYSEGRLIYDGSVSSSSGVYSSGGKCIVCNGTGYVRYYSGMYDEGTVGKCTSCNGTGRD